MYLGNNKSQLHIGGRGTLTGCMSNVLFMHINGYIYIYLNIFITTKYIKTGCTYYLKVLQKTLNFQAFSSKISFLSHYQKTNQYLRTTKKPLLFSAKNFFCA